MNLTNKILIAIRDYLRERGMNAVFRASYAGHEVLPVAIPCVAVDDIFFIRVDLANGLLLVWVIGHNELQQLGRAELADPRLFDIVENWMHNAVAP